MPARSVTVRVICGANGAYHALTGGFAPESTHAFTGVTAPTLDKGMGGKISAIDLSELSFVKPCLGAAVNLIAVVEHEAGTVGVTEVFQIGNLDAIAWLPCIQVIDQLLLGVEENKVELEFLLHALDLLEQIFFLLALPTADIAGLVNKPGDESIVTIGLAQFCKADAGGMHEIGPPMIVGNAFEFLPLDQRWPPCDDDILGFIGLLGVKGDASQREKEEQAEDGSVHGVGAKFIPKRSRTQSQHRRLLEAGRRL